MMKVRSLLLVLLLAAPALEAGDMVVFGDSLSDGGYFFGLRFTNGELWHEYLADRLGLERATTSGFFGSRGLNLAVGGALISDLPAQVNRYNGRHVWQTGDLCTLWIGGNDLRDNASRDMTPLAASVGTIIGQLASRGIDRLVVPNLPDLGAIPEVGIDPATAATRRAGTIAFNNALALELQARATAHGITIYLLDVFGMFDQLLTVSADYGFTNTVDPWMDVPGSPDADEYVFYDDIHPTTRSHALLAAAAEVLMDPAGTPLEVISWRINPDGSLRQTWLADPSSTYAVFTGPRLDQLAPAATFTGSPGYTTTVAPPSAAAGFFQTRRN